MRTGHWAFLMGAVFAVHGSVFAASEPVAVAEETGNICDVLQMEEAAVSAREMERFLSQFGDPEQVALDLAQCQTSELDAFVEAIRSFPSVSSRGLPGVGIDPDASVEDLLPYSPQLLPRNRPARSFITHWASNAYLSEVSVVLPEDEVLTGLDGSFTVTEGRSDILLTRTADTSREINAIRAADALAALRMAVGLTPQAGGEPASTFQYWAADANGDGRVTAADALEILKMAVRAPDSRPREWVFLPESQVSSANPTRTAVPQIGPLQGGENIVAVLRGDVLGTWRPPEDSLYVGSEPPGFFDFVATPDPVPLPPVAGGAVVFDVRDAASLQALDRPVEQIASRGRSRDGRELFTYQVYEGGGVQRSADDLRQGRNASSGPVSNLLAVDREGNTRLAIRASDPVKVMYTVVDPQHAHVYIALEMDYWQDGVDYNQFIARQNCALYRVRLSDNASSCVHPGVYVQQMDGNFQQAISGQQKPLNFDAAGNLYFAASNFERECHNGSGAAGSCWIQSQDWRPKIYRATPQSGAGDLGMSVRTLTADNINLQYFLVLANGDLVYRGWNESSNRDELNLVQGERTIRLSTDSVDVNYFTTDTHQAVMYGGWNTGGLRVIRSRPQGGIERTVLDTGVFGQNEGDSWVNSQPERILTGDDGRMYGVFTGSRQITSPDTNETIHESLVSVYQMLPYDPVPKAEISLGEGGNWWSWMQDMPIQISRGFLFYREEVDVPGYGPADTIRMVRVANRESTAALVPSDFGDNMFNISTWRLSGGTLTFSALDQARSMSVLGEIDVRSLREGRPVEEYLKLIDVASARGAAASVKDIEILLPQEPEYDPGMEPRATFLGSSENRYSIGIDFTKYMNKESVEAGLRLRNAAGQDIPAMRLWFYQSLYLIPDLSAQGLLDAIGRPLDFATEYTLTLAEDTTDAYGWLLDSNTLQFSLETDPQFGWLVARQDRVSSDFWSGETLRYLGSDHGNSSQYQVMKTDGGSSVESTGNLRIEFSMRNSGWGSLQWQLWNPRTGHYSLNLSLGGHSSIEYVRERETWPHSVHLQTPQFQNGQWVRIRMDLVGNQLRLSWKDQLSQEFREIEGWSQWICNPSCQERILPINNVNANVFADSHVLLLNPSAGISMDDIQISSLNASGAVIQPTLVNTQFTRWNRNQLQAWLPEFDPNTTRLHSIDYQLVYNESWGDFTDSWDTETREWGRVGEVLRLPAQEPDRGDERFVFSTWNTRQDGTGRNYQPGDEFTIDEEWVNDGARLYALFDRRTWVYLQVPTLNEWDWWEWNEWSDTPRLFALPGETIPLPIPEAQMSQGIVQSHSLILDHDFVFWSTSPEGSGERYTPGKELRVGEEDIFLYAHFDYSQGRPLFNLSRDGEKPVAIYALNSPLSSFVDGDGGSALNGNGSPGSNLLVWFADGTFQNANLSQYSMHALYTLVDPAHEYVYIALQAYSGDRGISSRENCSLFRVDLANNQHQCVAEGISLGHFNYEIPEYNLEGIKQLQWDAAGNLYALADRFSRSCDRQTGMESCVINKDHENTQIIKINPDGEVQELTERTAFVRAFSVRPNGDVLFVAQPPGNDYSHLYKLPLSEDIRVVIPSDDDRGSSHHVKAFAKDRDESYIALGHSGVTVGGQDAKGQLTQLSQPFQKNLLELPGGNEVWHQPGFNGNPRKLIITNDGKLLGFFEGNGYRPRLGKHTQFYTLHQVLPFQSEALAYWDFPDGKGFHGFMREVGPRVANDFLLTMRPVQTGALSAQGQSIHLRDLLGGGEQSILIPGSPSASGVHIITGLMERHGLVSFSAMDQDRGMLRLGMLDLNHGGVAMNAESASSIVDISAISQSDWYSLHDVEVLVDASVKDSDVRAELLFDRASRDSVTVKFTAFMDPGSVLSGLRLQTSTGQSINYVPLWLGKHLHLILTEPLLDSTEYTLELAQGSQSVTRSSLQGKREFVFTTSSAIEIVR